MSLFYLIDYYLVIFGKKLCDILRCIFVILDATALEALLIAAYCLLILLFSRLNHALLSVGGSTLVATFYVPSHIS